MRFVFDEQPPVSHPTVDLGCGNWCTFNYDSVISSALALVVTIIVAVLIAAAIITSTVVADVLQHGGWRVPAPWLRRLLGEPSSR